MIVTRAFAGPVCQSALVIGGKSEAWVAATSGVGATTAVGVTVAGMEVGVGSGSVEVAAGSGET